MAKTDCVHSYLIGLPDGRYSVGVCEKCGDEREMINVLPMDLDNAGWKETKEYLWLHNLGKDEKGYRRIN